MKKDTPEQKEYREKGQVQAFMAITFAGLLIYSFYRELDGLILVYACLLYVVVWTLQKWYDEKKEEKQTETTEA